MKVRLVYGWMILIAMCSAVAVVFYNREASTDAFFKKEFSGVIYEIKKTVKMYDNVYLTDGKTCVLLIDLIRREKQYDITIGDSLIKLSNTYCLTYKRKDSVLFMGCDSKYGVYFSDMDLKCPGINRIHF